MLTSGPRPFLTADWRHLLMLNYAVDPVLLAKFVPHGTELDTWNGLHYVSVVGFLFQNTRVLGWRIPWHVNFEEINLRFYVRRKTAEGWRRGVVFIREIVPRRAIAVVARVGYGEPYVCHRMRHKVETIDDALHSGSTVRYEWFAQNEWQGLSAVCDGQAQPLRENSEEEFITEHFWGYTTLKNQRCAEYEVAHPRWNIFSVKEARFKCDVERNYGTAFVETLSAAPISAFVAAGSGVTVYQGRSV